jgi:hypothetical protein
MTKNRVSLKVKKGRPVRRPLGRFCGRAVRAATPVLLLALGALSFPLEENLYADPPASAPARSASRALPHLTWNDFFAKVQSTGATFSDRLCALDGARVVVRGYAVVDPRPAGGIYLTHFPEGKLHPDDEDTLPWDSIGVVWKKGREVPAIPKQPSIEGTLHLGNRELGTERVILVLEDAVPHVEKAPKTPKPVATTAARPSASASPR